MGQPELTLRLRWLSEQALNWSGLPVVHMRPTVFMEGFFLRFAAGGIKKADRISLPMGSGKTSPICANDVARSVAGVLDDPEQHLGKIYDLTGPQSEDLHFYAREFSEVLGRPIVYEDIEPEAWKQWLLRAGLPAHLVDHVTAMAALNRDNRYDRSTDTVQRLTGAPPMKLRTFIEQHAGSFAS